MRSKAEILEHHPRTMLNSAQASRFICRTRMSMWRGIRDGDFPKPDVVVGNRNYWFLRTLEAWQNENRPG